MSKTAPTHRKPGSAKTLAGVIPLIGSPLAELITSIFGSPVSKRRDEWLTCVVEGLEETKARLNNFDSERLKDNEQFISATLQATQIAIRNHQKEKLEALRNAVLNTAIGINIDETEQLMFIEAIDALTPLHLRILKYFDNPAKYLQEKNVTPPQGIMAGSRSQILELALPEIKGNGGVRFIFVTPVPRTEPLGCEVHIARLRGRRSVGRAFPAPAKAGRMPFPAQGFSPGRLCF